jgi:hypothetical protein
MRERGERREEFELRLNGDLNAEDAECAEKK